MKMGMLLSVVNYFLTAAVAFSIYRMLDVNSSVDSAVITTIALIELSRLFTIADLGFTNNFIRRAQNKSKYKIYKIFYELKSLMFKVSLLSVALFALLVLFSKPGYVYAQPWYVILISFTLFFSIYAYSDTAYMKVKERFKSIYVVQIILNFVLILLLSSVSLLREYPLEFLILSGLFKVMFTFIYMRIATTLSINLKDKASRDYTGKAEILDDENMSGLASSQESWATFVAASYLLITLLDALLLSYSDADSQLLFCFLFVKKCFDIIKGVIESLLQVLMVYLARFKIVGIRLVIFFVFLFLGLATPMVHYFSMLWIEGFEISILSTFSVALLYLSLIFYRITSLSAFFKGILKRVSVKRIGILLLLSQMIFGLFTIYISLDLAFIFKSIFVFIASLILYRQEAMRI